jgi:Phage tail protein (Tail_P2_I)
MSTPSAPVNLFNLLPAIYRIRDANQGGALQNLFAILQDAHDTLDQDITNLYQNWFIETCAEWVVPYIGDLLGVAPLSSADIQGVTARAYVAHTLSYRRRKGTPVVLQQLAQDVTNWPACIVEFFQYLATTQYMNHLRPQNLAAPDLRNVDALPLLNGPFDQISHTVDVRGIIGPALSPSQLQSQNADTLLIRGKYNLPDIGLFLWRLKSYAVESVVPRAVSGANTHYRFNPLGLDEPLFNQPSTPPAPFTPVTGEVDVPGRLRRRALYEELEARRQAMVDQQMVWTAGLSFTLGFEIVDSNGNTQRVIATTAGGKSGANQPAWATTLGTDTGDGGITWQLAALGSSLPAAYFGAQPVFQIFPTASGSAIPPEQIMICDLTDLKPPQTAGTWRTPAAAQTYTRASDGAQISLPLQVAADPELGRIVFVTAPSAGPAEVRVNYSYGFSGDLGGGAYNRSSFVQAALSGVDQQASSYWQVAVSQSMAPVAGLVFADLASAVAAWNALPAASQRFGVIAVLDNGAYTGSLDGANTIVIPAGSTLLIVAAGWPSLPASGNPTSFQLEPENLCPHLIGDIAVQGSAPASSTNPGSLLLSGLLIEGSVLLAEGNLGTLSIADCTIVPSAGRIGAVTPPSGSGLNASLTIALAKTICGPVQLPAAQFSGLTLNVSDSIIDGGGGVVIDAATADASIDSTTVLGTIGSANSGLRTLTASNSIFTGTATVERVQAGCVRYSVLPTDTSKVPRRFRCQPDLALANAISAADQLGVRERLTPSFTSVTYGDPGYAQLSAACAAEIRVGAEDGSEMGAFFFLKQPQRDSNLRSVLPEYLRFGMQAGVFYVT